MSDLAPPQSRRLSVGEVIVVIITIVVVAIPMNATSRSVFLLVALGFALHLTWRSPWTITRARLYKTLTTFALSVGYLAICAWLFVSERREAISRQNNQGPVNVISWIEARILVLADFPWRWIWLGVSAGILLAVLFMRRRHVTSAIENEDKQITSVTTLDYVAQIKNLTKERDQANEAAIGFQNDAIELRRTMEKHGCPDNWLHEIANGQAGNIRDSIELIGVRVWTFDLHSALPTIKCGVLIKNHSLFTLDFDEEIQGDLYFNRHRLAERKFIRVITRDLPQTKEGEIIFDQRLSKPEAELIMSEPQGRFDFTNLSLTIRSQNTHVKPQEFKIPASFRPRLDEEINHAVLEVRESQSLKDTALGIPRGQLVISEAQYGTGNVWQDVSDRLRSRIYSNGTRLGLSDTYNDMFGDPLPGTPKILKVIYVYNGERFSVELPEDAKVSLPFPYVK